MIPPVIVPTDHDEILTAINTFINNSGTKVQSFEEIFSKYIGCDCLMTYSGRTALYVILKAYDLKKGDEIIIPAYMCPTVSDLLIDDGYKLKFVDVEKDTYNLSADDLNEKISRKTKAIITAHMFGNPCNMKDITEIAHDHGSIVIEDSAQTIGAEYGGRLVGTLGDAGFFSLGRGKPITTMGGGIIAINDKQIINKSKKIINNFKNMDFITKIQLIVELFGYSVFQKPSLYKFVYKKVGGQEDTTRKLITLNNLDFKYLDLQAAMGIIQLTKLKKFNNVRCKNSDFLMKNLTKLQGIILPKIDPAASPIFLRFPIQLKNGYGQYRSRLLEALKESGIKPSIVYPEILPRLYGYNENHPNASDIVKNSFSLPCHPLVKETNLLTMISIIKEELNKYKSYNKMDSENPCM